MSAATEPLYLESPSPPTPAPFLRVISGVLEGGGQVAEMVRGRLAGEGGGHGGGRKKGFPVLRKNRAAWGRSLRGEGGRMMGARRQVF